MAAPQDGDIPTRVRLYVIKAMDVQRWNFLVKLS